jgi:hypothetical protein
VGHTGAAEGFNQSFFDNTVFNVKGKLAAALLGSAPADTVGITGNIGDLLGLDPSALFGNGSGTVVGAFCYNAHSLNFVRGSVRTHICHCKKFSFQIRPQNRTHFLSSYII